jgi:membrane-anchored protein YejM (alkaline phosphatase superfamily)
MMDDNQTMQSNQSRPTILMPYLALTYVALLINTFPYLLRARDTDAMTVLFLAAVYIVYCFMYLLPTAVCIFLINGIASSLRLAPLFRRLHINPAVLVAVCAITATTLLQMLFFVDGFVFRGFGFHLNGFVWNLVCTKGGISSMGGDTATSYTVAAIMLGFLLIQASMFIILSAAGRIRTAAQNMFTKRRVIAGWTVIVILAFFQAGVFGVSAIRNYSPVLRSADVFPFYVHVTFSSLAKKLGFNVHRDNTVKFKVDAKSLRYPLNPLHRDPNHKNWNIVWLVAESFRADMLDPNIMPQTWEFAQKSLFFRNHYSGGNGTRMGFFAMFYGLYGNYWFNFLNEQRGPVLIDMLIENNYQMDMFTSAKFSYPEFNKTVFARIPKESMHDDASGESWQRDRSNVTDLLKFIDGRDPKRPFMTFMFFESPHARYDFPPENIICKPYLEEFNYATANIKRDIGLIKNRYINSCNHLDSQYGRIVQYLESNKLLDSTIVIITSDHGEEFMEKGYWGHNSSYVEEQVLSPLVLWAPGLKPQQISRMTSHLDLPPTIMKLLGVVNEPQDYSLGFDLLGTVERKFTIVSDWDTLVYVDKDFKAVFPLAAVSFGRKQVTTRDDVPVTSETAFYQSHQAVLLNVMKELTIFSEK